MSLSEIVSLHHVGKEYNGHQVLNDINLTLFEGEIISFLGVNGAGKTTLSSLIAAVHAPSQGTILYKGVSIHDDLRMYRGCIGYCPQKLFFQRGQTLYDTLWFAGQAFGQSSLAVEERIESLAITYGLMQFLHRMPHSLSGGYRQRFGIVRALLHNPHIIIFDEPTVALDPHVRREVWETIRALKDEGRTVVLTTHYLDEAEYLSDRVCFLDKGTVRCCGTPGELLKRVGKERLEEILLSFVGE